jgi:hypothetical protein
MILFANYLDWRHNIRFGSYIVIHYIFATEPTVEYTGFDECGELVEGTARGFLARIMQHEHDHLNGILYTDRLTSDSLYGDDKTMNKIKRKEKRSLQSDQAQSRPRPK